MIRSDAQRGYMTGVSLPLLTLTLVTVGFTFLSFMKIVFMERADFELQQEIDFSMKSLEMDALESATYEIRGNGKDTQLVFQKKRSNPRSTGPSRSDEGSMTYATQPKGGLVKFCRLGGTRGRGGLQPMTGESMFGDVTIQLFRAEALPSGGVHVVLEGRSRRTGHTYRQTAVYPLERKI